MPAMLLSLAEGDPIGGRVAMDHLSDSQGQDVNAPVLLSAVVVCGEPARPKALPGDDSLFQGCNNSAIHLRIDV